MPCSGWGNDLCVNSPEVNSVPNFDGKENFLMLDTKGRGHYVGCNLSVLHFQGSWWGEGDDMILIDDEEEPSINGTGAEDYFNHAWGMQRNQSPYNGTIMHDGDTKGYQVSYRSILQIRSILKSIFRSAWNMVMQIICQMTGHAQRTGIRQLLLLQ